MMPDKESPTTEPLLPNASKTSPIPKPSESKEEPTSLLLKMTSPLRSPDGTESKPSSTPSSPSSPTKPLPLMKSLTSFLASASPMRLLKDSTNDLDLYDVW